VILGVTQRVLNETSNNIRLRYSNRESKFAAVEKAESETWTEKIWNRFANELRHAGFDCALFEFPLDGEIVI
jgi:hypothetical protein